MITLHQTPRELLWLLLNITIATILTDHTILASIISVTVVTIAIVVTSTTLLMI